MDQRLDVSSPTLTGFVQELVAGGYTWVSKDNVCRISNGFNVTELEVEKKLAAAGIQVK